MLGLASNPSSPAFSVELVGTFHTIKLLDHAGRSITNIMVAAEIAEDEFGSDWDSVFNGDDAMYRDDWLTETN